MKQYRIVDLKDASRYKDNSAFSITYLRDDGVQWECAFPYEIFHSRCAEYGIDPTDTNTLIDIILHEPHITVSDTEPFFVYNTDEKTAREKHLERVAASKKEISYSDPDSHLQRLRDFHLSNYSQESIDLKRAHVGNLRSRRIKALASGGER